MEFNKDKNKYKGRQGLDRAIKELREFEKIHGKMPTSVSKGMPRIYNTIRRGEWREFGIDEWNDLLRSTFGEVYLSFLITQL
ncbi:hypothetical protein LCGC14_0873210 [marine sediment metagenome]|uniref:Uncharacterized protein n=1 Tax=marine sediment metagenome TaxID=412755 RepID=A0A0F9SB29_9ZZZZ